MAVKIRLKRFGRKKKPCYRIVVAEETTPRDGESIEIVGVYTPSLNPTHLEVKEDRVSYWLSVGAKPTKTVERLLGSLNLLTVEKRTSSNQKVSKKQLKEQA